MAIILEAAYSKKLGLPGYPLRSGLPRWRLGPMAGFRSNKRL